MKSSVSAFQLKGLRKLLKKHKVLKLDVMEFILPFLYEQHMNYFYIHGHFFLTVCYCHCRISPSMFVGGVEDINPVINP